MQILAANPSPKLGRGARSAVGDREQVRLRWVGSCDRRPARQVDISGARGGLIHQHPAGGPVAIGRRAGIDQPAHRLSAREFLGGYSLARAAALVGCEGARLTEDGRAV